MCVVICKEKNQNKPSETMLKSAWEHNPHGAGYIYVSDNSVIIKKGFMTFEEFWKEAKELPEDSAIVYHFRIATHGSKDEKGTHPFPITNDEELLQELWVEAPIGVAHNGIIQLCANYPADANPNNLSDTQLYIRDYLARINKINNKWYDDTFWLNIIDRTISSKLAILLPDHRIIKLGGFCEVEGYECSNSFFAVTKNDYWDNYYNERWSRPMITVDKDAEAILFDYENNVWHGLNEFDSVKVTARGVVFVNGAYKRDWGIFGCNEEDDKLGFLELDYDEILKLNKRAEEARSKKEEDVNDNTL